jgi:hypothetical protein
VEQFDEDGAIMANGGTSISGQGTSTTVARTGLGLTVIAFASILLGMQKEVIPLEVYAVAAVVGAHMGVATAQPKNWGFRGRREASTLGIVVGALTGLVFGSLLGRVIGRNIDNAAWIASLGVVAGPIAGGFIGFWFTTAKTQALTEDTGTTLGMLVGSFAGLFASTLSEQTDESSFTTVAVGAFLGWLIGAVASAALTLVAGQLGAEPVTPELWDKDLDT